MRLAFDNQVHRLKRAGFPGTLLTPVAETHLQNIKGKKKAVAVGSKTKIVRPAVVAYIHKVTHNLKKVAGRYGVPLALSASVKLGQLCPVLLTGQGRKAVARNTVLRIPDARQEWCTRSP